MTSAQHWMGPPGRGGPTGPVRAAHMRVSQADRDEVVSRLQTAFSEGRLDENEFDERLDRAISARTHGDLAPLLKDLVPVALPQMTGVQPLPQATVSERSWGMASHLLTFFTTFVGPLVILLAKGDESTFVRRQAAESLNFWLSCTIGFFVLIPASVLTAGFAALLYLPLFLLWFVLPLVATVKAANGVPYRYPLTLRLVS